jgi:hypothetical protein
MENSREFDRIVHRYRAELCVRYRPGIRTQTEDRCVLIREHVREFRAASEVLMDNLIRLGMRDTDLSPPDGRRTSNGGVIERVSKRVSTDHSCRADDDKVLLASRRSVVPNSEARLSDSSGLSRSSECTLLRPVGMEPGPVNRREPSIFTLRRARMPVPVDPTQSA